LKDMINDLRKCRTISQVISTWLAYIELAISNFALQFLLNEELIDLVLSHSVGAINE